ncbi:MAG TPA: DHA2 family efflux MFS transporter permease subunit, partial [Candidatus Dormibacteraeota bacterium]|nr:DHA2 family efflux MFS transporter permease subunit [Candidatus Dormibacteraeota bacterium]
MTEVLTAEEQTAVLPVEDDVEVAPARAGRFDYKWVALGVVLLGTIMTILDATIVNIAIPTLQVDLKAGSYNDIAWVVTGYMLAQGAVIPMTGWATDRFGTKRLYLITITLFTLASMACGLAQNLGELILFRVVQGIGGGMLMPIGMTIIMKAVGGQNMGKIMGIFGVPMLLAPALGPVLGGWFVQSFTWRLIFYVNVPIGIVAFIAATRFLVETHKTHGLRLDAFGLLTATPAVVAIMYAVDQSTTLGWTSALVITLLVCAALLATAFVLSQLGRRRAATLLMFPLFAAALGMGFRAGFSDGWTQLSSLAMFGAALIELVNVPLGVRGSVEPLLQLRLFKDGTFSWAMVLSFLIVTALFGAMLLLPLYLQQIRGYNALQTGLLLLPQAVTAAFAMPLGGALSDRFGPRPVVAFGLVLLAAGGVLLAQLHVDSSIWLVVAALLLRGFAMGFCMMPSMAAALARVAPELSSRASSITNSLQRNGSSIGIAVLVTVLVAQVSTSAHQTVCAPSQPVVFAASAVQHHPVTAAQLCEQLQSSLNGTSLQGGATAPRSSGNALYDSFVHSYVGNAVSTSFDRTFAFIAII